ncbi:MAG: Crp/Fnr family transcriptional regulator [Chloroflexi bacterium]|nr:Crp/Fnr family transcriptional regulator [Chloroflexota bacterium]
MLGEIPLFQGLSSAQLDRLGELLHTRTFPAAANVMTVEQPGEVAYVVVAGTVKVHVEQADGSDVILAILGPGEVVGEMGVVDNLGRSATVVTMERSTLLWMSRAAFWECLRSMPTMTYNLVGILSRRLRLANDHLEALAALDITGRVAHQILAFAREYGEPIGDGGTLIPIRLTQSDLASLIAASRVRVNRALVGFRRRRYLSIDRGHRITVHNAAALERHCQ